jgi:hypothetical protein
VQDSVQVVSHRHKEQEGREKEQEDREEQRVGREEEQEEEWVR